MVQFSPRGVALKILFQFEGEITVKLENDTAGPIV